MKHAFLLLILIAAFTNFANAGEGPPTSKVKSRPRISLLVVRLWSEILCIFLGKEALFPVPERCLKTQKKRLD